VAGTMEMKIWAETIGGDGKLERRELVVVRRGADQSQIGDFGLTLEEGKTISGASRVDPVSGRAMRKSPVIVRRHGMRGL